MLDYSNRVKSFENELYTLTGGMAYISLSTLKKQYFGLKDTRAVKRRLAGVPEQPGNLYRVKDVAIKLAQSEVVAS